VALREAEFALLQKSVVRTDEILPYIRCKMTELDQNFRGLGAQIAPRLNSEHPELAKIVVDDAVHGLLKRLSSPTEELEEIVPGLERA
jgi:hypothetical protein